MNYINKPETALQSLTISQAKLSIPAIFGSLFDQYEYTRKGQLKMNNKVYDVYQVLADNDEFIFYEDITCFYGKGNINKNLMELDVPLPNVSYPLTDFITEDLLDEKQYAEEKTITVKFKQYASNMVSNYIAGFYPQRNQIDVTAIKQYDKSFQFPVLHSYNLYKLFLIHQLCHVIKNHDFHLTENPIRGNYYQPIIGVDCITFTPTSERTHATEFINYTLWTHLPRSFEDENEKYAFKRSAFYGVNTNVFNSEELIKAIKLANMEKQTEEILLQICSQL
jgi:hypothetical protein